MYIPHLGETLIFSLQTKTSCTPPLTRAEFPCSKTISALRPPDPIRTDIAAYRHLATAPAISNSDNGDSLNLFKESLMTSLINNRKRAYERQGGICYYCALPMWQDNEGEVLAEYLGLKHRHIPWLRCTAEHLTARIDGGADVSENIAAACHFCNSRRHKRRPDCAPSADSYRAQVALCMARGHWHPAQSTLERWG